MCEDVSLACADLTQPMVHRQSMTPSSRPSYGHTSGQAHASKIATASAISDALLWFGDVQAWQLNDHQCWHITGLPIPYMGLKPWYKPRSWQSIKPRVVPSHHYMYTNLHVCVLCGNNQIKGLSIVVVILSRVPCPALSLGRVLHITWPLGL